ncbi:unnamed protein product [Adineta steineri]|uniref:Uncharacterized protein n=1 Tax=Adineta steineri TaxID=433720 RepID=A0A816EJQ9_9BILA|nr:unnamed protein product [Adineta steineri]CAF1646916.1 unnamed protein product [Adineta steineri]
MVIKISKKSFSINGYSLHNQSKTRLNIPFLFSQIFLDSLLKLKSNENDQNNLIHYLQHEYENNPNELNNIQQFKENYLSNKVLWWYKKKDFFFSSTLNAVLKTENLSMMFLFRSFLFDIKEQLRKYQSKQRLKVYRSQIMSIGDYYYYINNAISYLSINSFLSTTKSYSTACSLFDQLDIGSESMKVIFEINADPNVVTSKPFGDISELSNHSEILFMPGSIFRVEKCVYELNGPNIIQMTLCNENDLNLNEQIDNDMANPRLIGKILSKMGKNDLAEKYFQRLIEQLSSNDSLLADLYEDLSQVLSQLGNDQMSKTWYEKSIVFKQQYQLMGKSIGIVVAGGLDALIKTDYAEGLFVNHLGEIFVADNRERKITCWSPKSKNVGVIVGGNGKGYQPNKLNWPKGIAFDRQNNLYVTDSFNSRVQRFDINNS